MFRQFLSHIFYTLIIYSALHLLNSFGNKHNNLSIKTLLCNMHMNLSTYVYVDTHAYLHTYIYTHVYRHRAHIYICTHMCSHTCIEHRGKHTYMYIHGHADRLGSLIHTCTHMCTRTCIEDSDTQLH